MTPFEALWSLGLLGLTIYEGYGMPNDLDKIFKISVVTFLFGIYTTLRTKGTRHD
jgi:hypothetical protein